jgi:hypothetical protein
MFMLAVLILLKVVNIDINIFKSNFLTNAFISATAGVLEQRKFNVNTIPCFQIARQRRVQLILIH